jgi:hypothetical protein
MLDEIASAGRENLDVGHVARYDAKENANAGAELLLSAESSDWDAMRPSSTSVPAPDSSHARTRPRPRTRVS